MDSKEKKKLSESDICDLFITPAINQAGWELMTQIQREVTLTPDPVVVRGNMSSRNKKKKKFADYVLSWEPGVPVAVVEAKDNNHIVHILFLADRNILKVSISDAQTTQIHLGDAIVGQTV